jgi:hypothetical protein
MNKAIDMTKKTTRTRAEAKKLMWEYYSENKASLPKWIREFREEIISDLQTGADVNIVFLIQEDLWQTGT